jgi:3-hydroxyacyl-CoA dehydrogenase
VRTRPVWPKSGAGLYAYADGRTAEPDPAIEQLILDHSAQLGLVRRPISDEEIVSRCLLAMINEGARIVGEGIAYRPVDVDMTHLHGYGFPRDRGGPMFQADLLGLPARALQALAAGRNGWAFTPAPLILNGLCGQRSAIPERAFRHGVMAMKILVPVKRVIDYNVKPR